MSASISVCLCRFLAPRLLLLSSPSSSIVSSRIWDVSGRRENWTREDGAPSSFSSSSRKMDEKLMHENELGDKTGRTFFFLLFSSFLFHSCCCSIHRLPSETECLSVCILLTTGSKKRERRENSRGDKVHTAADTFDLLLNLRPHPVASSSRCTRSSSFCHLPAVAAFAADSAFSRFSLLTLLVKALPLIRLLTH